MLGLSKHAIRYTYQQYHFEYDIIYKLQSYLSATDTCYNE